MTDLEQRLDALLRKTVDRGRHVRHGLAGVAAADGSWSWMRGVGVLDPGGTMATADARYPIASVTKLFTAVVTMKLVEAGRLGLDDRMAEVLPGDVTAGLHVLDGIDRTGEITVEHLLSHTSGLADYYDEAPRGERSAQARLLAGEDAPMPFDEVLRTVRAMKPHFPPQPAGSGKRKARYADTNYQLLGAVLETVTKQPLHALFDQMIFAPLGLDATSSYPHPPRGGRSPEPDATVWAKDVALNPSGALTYQKADGGIISTVADQLRFMQALAAGDLFEDGRHVPEDGRAHQQDLLPGGLRARGHALRAGAVDVAHVRRPTDRRAHRFDGHLGVPLPGSPDRPRRRVRRGAAAPPVPLPSPRAPGRGHGVLAARPSSCPSDCSAWGECLCRTSGA